MSLFAANLLPGLVLLALGAALLLNTSAIRSTMLAFPRSHTAAVILFGGAAVWFLFNVWHLPEADFGEFRKPLLVFFGLVSVGAFFYVPDFLAVRGAAILVLLSASPLLAAGYMNYSPTIYPLKVIVYVALALAIWVGASPFRLRDFLQWTYRQPGRPRAVGGALAMYGAVLCVLAFV